MIGCILALTIFLIYLKTDQKKMLFTKKTSIKIIILMLSEAYFYPLFKFVQKNNNTKKLVV